MLTVTISEVLDFNANVSNFNTSPENVATTGNFRACEGLRNVSLMEEESCDKEML